MANVRLVLDLHDLGLVWVHLFDRLSAMECYFVQLTFQDAANHSRAIKRPFASAPLSLDLVSYEMNDGTGLHHDLVRASAHTPWLISISAEHLLFAELLTRRSSCAPQSTRSNYRTSHSATEVSLSSIVVVALRPRCGPIDCRRGASGCAILVPRA